MAKTPRAGLAEVLRRQGRELVDEWVEELRATRGLRVGQIREAELRPQCEELMSLLQRAIGEGVEDRSTPAWEALKEVLARTSRTRAAQGYLPSDTARLVLSVKGPLLRSLRRAYGDDAEALTRDALVVTDVIDDLALLTTEVFQRTRDEVIARQQEELLELSTPVVKLWEGIVALPMIGTLDSARTQVVMESLLRRIVETGARIAIIDITGVPTVDTLTAQHLLKTIAAARMMGAECIISGIRPQIAQTMVHLAIDLSAVTTRATLADALATALERGGVGLRPAEASP